MVTPLRSLLLLALAGSGSLLFTACDEPGGVAYEGRPAYYGGGGEADFYYVSGRPYSRHYGALVSRDGGYYYNQGGSYVIYEQSARRPYRVDERYDRGSDRGYDRGNGYNRDRDVNYRNVTVNNYDDRARARGTYGNQPYTGERRAPYAQQQQYHTAQQAQAARQEVKKKKKKDNDHDDH